LAFLPITLCSLGRRFKPTFSAGAVASVVLFVSPLLAGVYVFATTQRRKVCFSLLPQKSRFLGFCIHLCISSCTKF
jgi:hypothetical protein